MDIYKVYHLKLEKKLGYSNSLRIFYLTTASKQTMTTVFPWQDWKPKLNYIFSAKCNKFIELGVYFLSLSLNNLKIRQNPHETLAFHESEYHRLIDDYFLNFVHFNFYFI